MKITVLADNRASNKSNELQTEHGLSFYIEHNNQKVLCDMGATSMFADNAELLGIDLGNCDFAFISHGHNDHCGGLGYFLENIKGKDVYIHSAVPKEEYISTRHETRRNLSCNNKLFDDYKERFRFLDTTTRIAEGCFAVQCNEITAPMPYGNCFLLKNSGEKEENDTFGHELSLAFVTDKGLVIVSPCSHCGALNIIHECKKATECDKVHAYIGGLHFVEGENCATEATLFAEAIKSQYPDTLFITGHCTCDTAKDILEKASNGITAFSTGDVIEL